MDAYIIFVIRQGDVCRNEKQCWRVIIYKH